MLNIEGAMITMPFGTQSSRDTIETHQRKGCAVCYERPRVYSVPEVRGEIQLARCPVARRVTIVYSSIVVAVISRTCKDETRAEIALIFRDWSASLLYGNGN